MPYGRRKYGRLKKEVAPPSAIPTFVCNHCTKIRQFTAGTLTLTGVIDNATVITGRICEDCSKILREWMGMR